MWAGNNRWDRGSEPIGEINVTPLVDVMLVLLIIFMITAPMLTQGVDVDLPDNQAPAMKQNIEPLVISIQKDGTIYMQDKPTTLAQLSPRVAAILKNNKNLHVFIRGDAKTPYEAIARVMVDLENAGIKKVGLVTEPGK
ncbi:MAG: protein TolR [Zetaproteobacteria bacterium]|nr:protein TolR [Zetaproteobacteria bacterium]